MGQHVFHHRRCRLEQCCEANTADRRRDLRRRACRHLDGPDPALSIADQLVGPGAGGRGLRAEHRGRVHPVLPRHVELVELDQLRGLSPTERAELAVGYASLYPTYGDEGVVQVAAVWILTKPTRQARGS